MSATKVLPGEDDLPTHRVNLLPGEPLPPLSPQTGQPAGTYALMPTFPSVPQSPSELTARELEVFKLVARGLSNAEIAAELIVSETTGETHVAQMLMQLGLRNRLQAVVLADESGISVPGHPSS